MGYKILVVNWRDIKNPNVGGAEVNFQEIFKRLVRRGHQVTLLCSRHDHTFPEEEWIDGIRIIRRGNRNTFNYTVPVVYKREFSNSSIDILVEDCNKIPFYTPLYVRHPLFVIIHAVANKDNRFRLFLRIVSEIGQLLAVARLEFFHNRPPA